MSRLALFLDSPAIADRLLTEVNRRNESNTAPFQEQLKRVAAAESSLRSRSLRCYELFEDGHIDGTSLKQKLEEIRGETEKLQLEREKLEQTISGFSVQTYPPEHVKRAVEDIAVILSKAAPDKKKALYRSLIKSITVPPDRDMEHAVIHGDIGLLHLNIPPILIEKEVNRQHGKNK
ncbi:hypothetical protein [Paenibacillus sophorae]|nr:hypothetical protein [Paenibacillus sophorae]